MRDTHLAHGALHAEDGLVGRGAQVQEAVVQADVLAHGDQHLVALSSGLDVNLWVWLYRFVLREGGVGSGLPEASSWLTVMWDSSPSEHMYPMGTTYGQYIP